MTFGPGWIVPRAQKMEWSEPIRMRSNASNPKASHTSRVASGCPVRSMRVLLIGAGVIGTVYGVQLAESGHSVDVLAHGRRTERVDLNRALHHRHGHRRP